MQILAIVGSPRPKGNTSCLVDLALEEATQLGAQTEKLILSKYQVNPCLGHEKCGTFDSCLRKDDTGWILDKMCRADGVILATPVYYYNVSAQMKAFIDRNYFLFTHKRKSGARAVGFIVVAHNSGIEPTLNTLKQFVRESFIIEKDCLFTISGFAHKAGEVKKNPSLTEDARKLGRQLLESLR